jgi:uncharacterized membrane protein
MIRLRNEWLQLLLLLTPFCIAALLWDKLPERMPIHWNARGEVDGYAGRTFAALFVPMISIGMALLVGLLAFIDPKVRKADAEARANFQRVFKAIRLTLTGFMTAVGLAVICIGAGYPLDMSRVIAIGLALLFGVLGNLMGKLRPNYFVGIRTPWTLESREVWIKTHRLTGRLMVAVAVVLVAAGLVLPSAVMVWVAVSGPVLVLFVSVLYSFLAYKGQPA